MGIEMALWVIEKLDKKKIKWNKEDEEASTNRHYYQTLPSYTFTKFYVVLIYGKQKYIMN